MPSEELYVTMWISTKEGLPITPDDGESRAGCTVGPIPARRLSGAITSAFQLALLEWRRLNPTQWTEKTT